MSLHIDDARPAMVRGGRGGLRPIVRHYATPELLARMDGIPIAHIARVAGFTETTIRNVQRGASVSLATLEAIAGALEILEKDPRRGMDPKSRTWRPAVRLPRREGESDEQLAVREGKVLRLAQRMARRYKQRDYKGTATEWALLVRLAVGR